MSEQKPDFSNGAYLFPHINREGVRFGVVACCVAALAVAGLVAVSVFGTVDAPGAPAMRLGAFAWSVALAVLATILSLLAYGVFLFFRDPERYPPTDEKAILSPADGRVCMVCECPMPDSLAERPEVAGRKFWRVSVFMSVFNVHVNRMPTAGEILEKEYVAAGKFLNASLDKASKENERCNYVQVVQNYLRYSAYL